MIWLLYWLVCGVSTFFTLSDEVKPKGIFENLIFWFLSLVFGGIVIPALLIGKALHR